MPTKSEPILNDGSVHMLIKSEEPVLNGDSLDDLRLADWPSESADAKIVLSGELRRPPPNSANKAARKQFLNRYYINLAVEEIIRLDEKNGLDLGLRLKFLQEGGFFSTPAPTSRTCLLNAHEFDRHGTGLGGMTNAEYNLGISLVPPPRPRKGYKVEQLKEQYIITARQAPRNERKKGVREQNAQHQAVAEARELQRKKPGYVESVGDRLEREEKESRKKRLVTQKKQKKMDELVKHARGREWKEIDRSVPG